MVIFATLKMSMVSRMIRQKIMILAPSKVVPKLSRFRKFENKLMKLFWQWNTHVIKSVYLAKVWIYIDINWKTIKMLILEIVYHSASVNNCIVNYAVLNMEFLVGLIDTESFVVEKFANCDLWKMLFQYLILHDEKLWYLCSIWK